MGDRGLDEEVGAHFGRVPNYTIVDTETGEVKVIVNTSEHAGGVGLPPDIIHAAGADTMVVSNLGRRAITLFEELGIMVYTGASGTVKDAIRMLNAGELEAATDQSACTQRAFHDMHQKD